MPRDGGWDAIAEEVMANWPKTGVVVVAEKSSYPFRRILHLRCDQGDLAAKIDSEPGSVDNEQRLAVLAGTRASCTPLRTITLLEHIPAPVITGDADAFAG